MGGDELALIRRVRFRCWLSVTVAGSATALLLLPGLVLTWPVFFPAVPMRRAILLQCAFGIPYLVLAILSAWWYFLPRTLDPALEWLREGRPATPAERQLVA